MFKFNRLKKKIVAISPRFWVKLLYHDIWTLRKVVHNARKEKTIPVSCRNNGWKYRLYTLYWESYGSFIGIDAVLEEGIVFPHKPLSVFISNWAHIGKRCVIFQQVTIGSNMFQESKGFGSPYLEDGVFVGSGAKIIGNVHVGKNARIGANCVVVKDVPDNSVTVIRGIETIVKDEELNNAYIVKNPVSNG